MREYKKDLLTKYILIDNYSDYVYGHLHRQFTLDNLHSTGEFDRMLRSYTITIIKNKIKGCLDIYRTGKLAKIHPSLLSILDRLDTNKAWKKNSLKVQYNELAEKINKAIAKISPSDWYKVSNINLDNNTIRVGVETGWRYFDIHCDGRQNGVGDCSVEIPSFVLTLHHETDNADQSTQQLTELCEEDNKSIIQVMTGVMYLYNNKHILDDICQAMHNYETEKERIEAIYEGNNDSITNDGTAILESAARQAYLDGKLNV